MVYKLTLDDISSPANGYELQLGDLDEPEKSSFNTMDAIKNGFSALSPIQLARDVAGGSLRAGQNLASTMGEASQAISSLAEPLRKYIPESMRVIPDVNMREELGLGKNNPVDIGRLIGGEKSNPVTQAMAQYVPGMMAGGASPIGQIVSNAAWGAAQGAPDESHLGGLLPSGRPGAAIESGAFAAIPAAISKAIGFMKPLTNKALSQRLINTHDQLESQASKGFEHVAGEVEKRDIGSLAQPGLVSAVSEYFPRTKTAAKLLTDAEKGNYESLRKVQSYLYKRGKKNIRSNSEVDNLRGEEMLERRDDVNSMISDKLRKSGNDDLANILDESRKNWRTLQQTYYNPYMKKSIINMVDPNIRRIPKNLVGILQEESKPMQALKDFHPGLGQAVSRSANIRNIGKYGMYGGGGILAEEYLRHKLFGG